MTPVVMGMRPTLMAARQGIRVELCKWHVHYQGGPIMKRWFGVLVGLVGLVLVTPSTGLSAEVICGEGGVGISQNAVVPIAQVLVGDEPVDLSQCIRGEGKIKVLQAHF